MTASYLKQSGLVITPKPAKWKEVDNYVASQRWYSGQSIAMVIVYNSQGENRFAAFVRTSRGIKKTVEWDNRVLSPELVLEMYDGVHYYIPN